MFREKGPSSSPEIPDTNELVEGAHELLSKADASLTKENNPILAEELDKMGIPYPTTPEEWDRAGEMVDQRRRELGEKAQLLEEEYNRLREPIRQQRRAELEELSQKRDQLRSQQPPSNQT